MAMAAPHDRVECEERTSAASDDDRLDAHQRASDEGRSLAQGGVRCAHSVLCGVALGWRQHRPACVRAGAKTRLKQR